MHKPDTELQPGTTVPTAEHLPSALSNDSCRSILGLTLDSKSILHRLIGLPYFVSRRPHQSALGSRQNCLRQAFSTKLYEVQRENTKYDNTQNMEFILGNLGPRKQWTYIHILLRGDPKQYFWKLVDVKE